MNAQESAPEAVASETGPSGVDAAAEAPVAPSRAPRKPAARRPARKTPEPAAAASEPDADAIAPEADGGDAAPASAAAKPRAPRKPAAAKAPVTTAKATSANAATAKATTVKAATAKATTARKPAAASAARKPAAAKTTTTRKPAARKQPAPPPAPPKPVVLQVRGLEKRFGEKVAVAGVDLEVREGSIYGVVGPNGAGKTTTLSMVTGLLRPDAGEVTVHGADVWGDPERAKRNMGVLPDRLRLFDRLTGAQLLHYSGVLRGLDPAEVRRRSADLVAAFGLEEATGRLVTDYSAGMTKKIALACAMIHSPRLLVLDEPFESVDPVSAANVTEILQRYVASGGTVVLSSHSMDLIQRVCDTVAVVVNGHILASGSVDEVRAGASLEERFVELVGGRKAAEGMEWLHTFSD